MPGTYELKRAGTQYMWNLKAANGEPILTSERYVSKDGAKNGIESCKVNSAVDERYEKRTSTTGQHYFVLKAGNREIIGTSEMYSSAWARDNGIASCKTNGPYATTVDRT